MNIALFGGSFDPPHVGHEMIIYEALNSLHVEKLFVTPTYLNPLKEEFFAPSELRIKWLNKLFADIEKVEICEFEIKQKRATYTIETIKYLLKKYNPSKFYLIIGADNYKVFNQWRDYKEIQNLCELVIASRNGTIFPQGLKKLDINANISSSKLRANMDASFIPKIIRNEVIEYYKENNGKKDRKNS